MRPTYQRTIHAPPALLAAAVSTALAVSPAFAASTLIVRGAGFGHGAGMSQEGALGMADHGFDYRAILAHYFTGTGIGVTPPSARVRVLLQANVNRASLSGASPVNGRRLRPNAVYTITLARGGRVTMRTGRRARVTAPLLRVTGRSPLRLRGTADSGVRAGLYRGALELRPAQHGGLNAIDAVAVDDYVRGVVAAEVPASWPAAALQAQAVASRTYAITSHARPASGFDVYSDTRSQVYEGVAGETMATNAAVAATSGQVVTYQGQPVDHLLLRLLRRTHRERRERLSRSGRPRPGCEGSTIPTMAAPSTAGGRCASPSPAAAKRLSGLVHGQFRGIEVLRRGFSPRILSAEVLGSAGPTAVTGAELAARLGLLDTWAQFSVSDGGAERPEPDLSGQSPGAAPPAAPAPGTPSGGTPSGGTAAG